MNSIYYSQPSQGRKFEQPQQNLSINNPYLNNILTSNNIPLRNNQIQSSTLDFFSINQTNLMQLNNQFTQNSNILHNSNQIKTLYSQNLIPAQTYNNNKNNINNNNKNNMNNNNMNINYNNQINYNNNYWEMKQEMIGDIQLDLNKLIQSQSLGRAQMLEFQTEMNKKQQQQLIKQIQQQQQQQNILNNLIDQPYSTKNINQLQPLSYNSQNCAFQTQNEQPGLVNNFIKNNDFPFTIKQNQNLFLNQPSLNYEINTDFNFESKMTSQNDLIKNLQSLTLSQQNQTPDPQTYNQLLPYQSQQLQQLTFQQPINQRQTNNPSLVYQNNINFQNSDNFQNSIQNSVLLSQHQKVLEQQIQQQQQQSLSLSQSAENREIKFENKKDFSISHQYQQECSSVKYLDTQQLNQYHTNINYNQVQQNQSNSNDVSSSRSKFETKIENKDLTTFHTINQILQQEKNEQKFDVKKEIVEYAQNCSVTQPSLYSSSSTLIKECDPLSEFDFKEKSQITRNKSCVTASQFTPFKLEDQQNAQQHVKKDSFSSENNINRDNSTQFDKKEVYSHSSCATQNDKQILLLLSQIPFDTAFNSKYNERGQQEQSEKNISENSIEGTTKDTIYTPKKISHKRKGKKEFTICTFKKQKTEDDKKNSQRTAFVKRNNDNLINEQIAQNNLKCNIQLIKSTKLNQESLQDGNQLEPKQKCTHGEQESEQEVELIQKKRNMQNESNYTKNILKGFRRFFIKMFYNNKKLMNNFEKYYSINSLNNEFVMKLLTVSPYASYFKEFLEQDPEWWMNDANIANKERQREIFNLYKKQDISLIKTKRKKFNQKIIHKLEKSNCKFSDGIQQSQIQEISKEFNDKGVTFQISNLEIIQQNEETQSDNDDFKKILSSQPLFYQENEEKEENKMLIQNNRNEENQVVM